jgi:thiaminase/transcriptional activator TenA
MGRVEGVSQRLRAEHDELWEACFAHPFVQGIGRGDLTDERFRTFLVQDYLFLIDYARVLAYASAKAPDLDSQTWFARLLDATLSTEMDLHRKTCAEWGIAAGDLEGAEPLPTTVAYTSFLVRTAAAGDIGELACALLPCQWGYADIGVRLKQRGLPEHPRYAAWIDVYADPVYVELTGWLRAFVDRLGRAADEATYGRWRRIFATTLRYELAFWEMAWAGEGWMERSDS